MLQIEQPDTFVLATNRTEPVRYFAELAFNYAGIQVEWQGKDEQEVGIDISTGKELVKINPKYYRPAEVDQLCGNPEKAKRIPGWQPKTTLEQLCQSMVEADLERNTGSLR